MKKKNIPSDLESKLDELTEYLHDKNVAFALVCETNTGFITQGTGPAYKTIGMLELAVDQLKRCENEKTPIQYAS